MYTQIKKQVSNYYLQLAAKYSEKTVKQALLGSALVLVLGGGFFGHRYYIKYREERAFAALDAVIDAYEKVQYEVLNKNYFKDRQVMGNIWDDVEILLDSLYKEHSGSYLAPYFLVYKSNIVLQKEENVDKARELLDLALQKMTPGSIMYEMFDFKRIQMGMDSADESVRKQCLLDFIAMAQNKKGYFYQEAGYKLGLYYVSNNELDKAKAAWQSVLDDVDKNGLLQAPWVALIKDNLNSLA